jgi:hypothetical protein
VTKTITVRYLQRAATAGMIGIALQGVAAMGQTGLLDVVRPPNAPSDIQVPAGNKPFLKAYAAGTQNYICLGSSWTFLGPQATLFLTFQWINGEARQQIATHFLSPNPSEDGMARPTWQSSLDTSAVWGKVKASSSDSTYVAAGAIPWLLLDVAGRQRGPMGGSSLSQTTFIQRVNTTGGAAPLRNAPPVTLRSCHTRPITTSISPPGKACRLAPGCLHGM